MKNADHEASYEEASCDAVFLDVWGTMKVLLVGGPADGHVLPLSEEALEKGRIHVSARRQGETDSLRHRYDVRPFEYRGRVYLVATAHDAQPELPELVAAIEKCRGSGHERPSAYKARPGSPLDTWAPDANEF